MWNEKYRVVYCKDEDDEAISPVIIAPNQRHVRPNLDNISTAFLSRGFFLLFFGANIATNHAIPASVQKKVSAMLAETMPIVNGP